jgi:glycosyltransferase involved in cell wall biosynthesis
MRLSIVIPTFNRSLLLPQTIPALAHQQTTPDLTYEVIFVSNGSSDKSDAILRDSVSRYPDMFRYFCIAPTGGPSAPRNVGIRAATGDVVIIMDDDVLPDPDHVLQHSEFHQKFPELHHAAIGELYVPEDMQRDPMSLFHAFNYTEVKNLDRLSYLHFWTCNVSLKRQFMLESGMFNESFLYYEDVLCGYKLAGHGMHLHFWPSARGQHLHQLKPTGLPSKGRFTGRWLYSFSQTVPDPAANRRFGIIAKDIGGPLIVKRLLNRTAFRILDNPFTMTALRLLGATSGVRTRISDLYYYIIFRRNVVAGYYQAKREARAGKRGSLPAGRAEWVDRGEAYELASTVDAGSPPEKE